MTLQEAARAFATGRRARTDAPQADLLAALLDNYSTECDVESVNEFGIERIHDFLGRWYVEQADFQDRLPTEISALLETLVDFLVEISKGSDLSTELEVIRRLEVELPGVQKISRALREYVASQGGGFSFPEFLTSFEEGGGSRYDLDAPGRVGSIDGFFRVKGIEGGSVELEELLSESVVAPVELPDELIGLLAPGILMNLELVRTPGTWKVTGAGHVYPPGASLP